MVSGAQPQLLAVSMWFPLECHQTNLATGGQTARDSDQPSVHACFPEPGGYLSPYSSPDMKEVTSVLTVHVT